MKYLIISALALTSTILMAQENTLTKTVSVTAKSEMDVSPDQVVYSININQKKFTFEEAYDALDKEINKAIDLLIKEKIKKEDIKTTAYNVQKSYRWKNDKRIDDGFIASSRIEAKNKLDTRNINRVLSRFAKSSPDLNLNIGFAISDNLIEESNEKLLSQAVRRAKNKATTICIALGKDLGEIQNITYSEIGSPRPVFQQKNIAMARTMSANDEAAHGSIDNVKEIKLNLSILSLWEIK